MNYDKRYCQNRVRKRKKQFETSFPTNAITSVEDERQFKLERFVKDVNKFMEDKGHFSNQNEPPIDIGIQSKETIKRPKPTTNLVGRRGLFQNGIQTKFYSRGIYGKERTARLDEDLQQIISLANKENVPNSHHYRHQVEESRNNEPTKPADHSQPHSRTSSHCSSFHPSPTPHCARLDYAGLCIDKSPSFLDELDSKLYPEFTRIITLSSIESKSKQFQNKSYVTALKMKLLEMYQQGKKENSEEQSCVSEVQKSSVGTSPMRSLSPLTEPHPCTSDTHNQYTTTSEPGFEFNFVPEPHKSTAQFLEETIGPGSSCKTLETLSEPHMIRTQTSSPDDTRHLITCQEEVLSERYCDPFPRVAPVNTYSIPNQEEAFQRRIDHCGSFPRATHVTTHFIPNREEVLQRKLEHNEPLPRVPSVVQPFNLMMPFDGGGDRPSTSSISNLFLLPQEESPVFQYFPRKMY